MTTTFVAIHAPIAARPWGGRQRSLAAGNNKGMALRVQRSRAFAPPG